MYPGVRCDIPAHVYQSSYAPNPEWSEKFAQGHEIREYWQKTARDHGVYRHLELGRRVHELRWDQKNGIWTILVENLETKDISENNFDFVLIATGRFNSWKMPDFAQPGNHEYGGVLRHAQNWDPDFDPTGKRVAVVGNGASGIQLVANLQNKVAQLDHYARNPTWIAASFSGDDTSTEPIPIPPEDKATFSDPAAYLEFRKSQTEKYWRRINGWLRDHPDNTSARADYTANFHAKLGRKRPGLLEKVIPTFSPHCRRLTPGPGYLEALASDHVDYITTPISHLTPTGIETTDGTHRAVDAIFCATGGHGQTPQFRIRGATQTLDEAWGVDHDEEEEKEKEKDKKEEFFPYNYLGLATPGFPNLGFLLGPNGSARSGTAPYAAEVQATFFARLLRKMSREGVRSVQPGRAAADDFCGWCDAFFRGRTVLSENCSSWYNGGKPGGRVFGLWPGSAAHMASVLREPRWEDWEWEYLGGGEGAGSKKNRFTWYFGDGSLAKEHDPESDMTGYLRVPGEQPLKDLHESWWSIP